MPINYNKVNNSFENIIDTNSIDLFKLFNLDKNVYDKLFTYQIYHLYELLVALRANDIIVNGSDAGTGKTFVTAALCKEAMNIKGVKISLKPIVFCKKQLITYWTNVLKSFDIEPVAVINYEMVTGNRNEENFKHKNILTIDHTDDTVNRFHWKVKSDYCIIFDEVHCCKNSKSLHGKLLLSTKNLGIKIIMLSATISSIPKDFYVFGYMLGFYNNVTKGKSWVKSRIEEDQRNLIKSNEKSLVKAIYPFKGSRMDINELDDTFSKNNIIAMGYDLDNDLVDSFNAKYNFISKSNVAKICHDDEICDVKDNTNKHILSEITKARIDLELYKINILKELTKDYIKKGFNVVIFLNFNKTIDILSKKLNTKNIINGYTPNNVKEELCNNFQTNKINLLICNIKAGGESINLNNKLAKSTVSLITTNLSGIKLKQALGRIYRAGTYGYVLQKIIYYSNTYEEKLWNGLKDKIKFIDQMNGQDLDIFDTI